MKRRLSRHIGNRGAVLLILGVLWILTATGIASSPVSQPGKLLPYEHLPIWFRVALWGVPGAVAIASGLLRRWDVAAWTLLIIPVTERALSLLWAWGVDLFAGGYPAAWRGVLVYMATGILIYFCARGLDQPPTGDPDRWTVNL